jgi:glyceraldehyde-3-phosphate dehydrogenase (ferredoxin)
MGGAGLVFDNLGVDMIAISGKSASPAVLYLNRSHGEEIRVEFAPIETGKIWKNGRGGVYSLMDECLNRFGHRYANAPRILAVGPAAAATDFGAVCSAPVQKGKVSFVDTWAGRGGFGTKLLQAHGIAAVIYGGTFVDEDFKDRKVADSWFRDKYQKKLAAKDFESTTKYRFDPKFQTGGTFGVNYAGMAGRIIAFNYGTIHMNEAQRIALHKDFILDHYLSQFNRETIDTKSMRNCGEPCAAVCKKMKDSYKKDYEPYQALGPLCGIFDQRAAEKLNHHADTLGFDAISVGGVLAGLLEALTKNLIEPGEIGVPGKPIWEPGAFRVERDSMYNAGLGVSLLDGIIERKGILNFQQGLRKFARHEARQRGKDFINCFLYNAFARKGWSIPNQYWTPGVLSPMAIMGKYYMYYGQDFYPPRELGRKGAGRLVSELVLDNLGFCRFHRTWAEEMLPDIIEKLYGVKEEFLKKNFLTAVRINNRNASVFWESEKNINFVISFLKRKHEVEHDNSPDLQDWLNRFHKDKHEAALTFWFEMQKGIHETLREF